MQPVYGMAHLLGVFPFYNADHITEVQFDRTNSNSKYGGRLSSTVSVLPYQIAPKEFFSTRKFRFVGFSSNFSCSHY